MREHRFDFLRRESREQRVEEHHAACAAESGEVRVAVSRTPRSVNDEQPARGELATLKQLLDPLARRSCRQRREFIEQRRNHCRKQHQHQDLKREPREPYPQPPQRARVTHQPQCDDDQRHAEHDRNQRALEDIGKPKSERGPIEAKALLDAKRVPPGKRQADGAADDGDRDQQQHVAPQRRDIDPVRPAEKKREAAAKREQEQYNGIDNRFDDSEPLLRDGVISRFLMRRQSDPRCECGRHRRAMRSDVCDLAAREPQSHEQRYAKRCNENERESTGGHLAISLSGVGRFVCENGSILRAPLMPLDANRLIWIDMEMTGLAPETDRILELALIVTDSDLNTVAVAPVWVLHQHDAALSAMDAWNQSTHGRSGLVEKVRASLLSEAEVESAALAFLREHVPPKASPMCGNSICQDRRFLARTMPALEDYFHYRNLDVSTLKELARRWKPDLLT